MQQSSTDQIEREKGLKERLLGGAVWTVISQVVGNGIRLASNLILTRLLYPEAFGIMALVQVFLQALQMFSDLGSHLLIIQHKDGEKQEFRNVVWTVGVIRGVILWGLSVAIAYPLSVFYQIPQLQYLIPFVGVAAVFDGLVSTRVFVANRQMKVRTLAIYQLVSQAIGVVLMVVLVFLWPSIWMLAVGGVMISVARCVLSFTYLTGSIDRFSLEKKYLSEVIGFGQWIFVGSIFGFLGSQSDRLILGKLLTPTMLGVYSIAYQLYLAVPHLIQKMIGNIVLPAYSELFCSPSKESFAKVIRIRKMIMMCAFPPLCLLAIAGRYIVYLLYDPRYYDAGWILEILAIDGLFYVLFSSIEPVILAHGDSYSNMWLNGAKAVMALFLLVVGWYTAGLLGLVLGLALVHLALYPLLIVLVKKYDVWTPRLDLSMILLALSVVFLGKTLFF